MSPPRRAVPAALAAASIVLLLLAGSATAAVSTGESTAPVPFEEPIPEATLVKGSASYDTAGSVSFTFTTAAPPLREVGGKANEIQVEAMFLKSSGPCDSFSSVGLPKPPLALLVTSYSSPEAAALVQVSEEKLATATKSVSGSTTTLTATSGDLADVGLNCAYLTITNTNEGGSGGSAIVFPLVAPASPPPPPPPTPKPPPPKLAIVKPKPVALKPGKWKTVKVKVKNVSEFSSQQGALKLKPAKGIKLRPAGQKLPALTPGGSWTLSFQVQASEDAKSTSKLPITASAPGSTAKSSLTVKLKS